LEQDTVVLKWLRPAPNQFNIYWDRNAHRYEPDFVAETQDTIYLIEIKKVSDMDDREVQEKAKAALEYCKNATDYDLENGDKSWKYVLIPHDEVNFNMGFETLMKRFMYGE